MRDRYIQMKNEGRFEIQWFYEYYLMRCERLSVTNILNPEPFRVAFTYFWQNYSVEITKRLNIEFNVNQVIGKDESIIKFY